MSVDVVHRIEWQLISCSTTRFGPISDSWKNCVTLRDFMQRGVMNGTLYWYGITLGLQLVIAGELSSELAMAIHWFELMACSYSSH